MTGKELTQAIEESLKSKNISKAQFYKDCGISPATFSNWKNNVYFPSKENLSRIQEITGLSFGIVDPDSNLTDSGMGRLEG